ncbi:MAG: GNAT family N-acetyltransferase [Acidobacteria bacterium]|nr:GNAT family N-acetyltransferase [Acidobacteriota bacterium]
MRTPKCDQIFVRSDMLETERLTLRKMTDADLDAIYAMRSDADVMRYIREPQKRAEAANWIDLVSSRWESEGIGFCAMIIKETGEVAGWCGLWKLAESDEIEVGYAVAKRFWRRGYAVEAALRLLEYGFEVLGLEKIVAVAREQNLGSRRVMEKIGMEFDYIGHFYDSELVHYSITREEFFNNDRN